MHQSELGEARHQKLLAAERQMALSRAIIILFGSASYFLLDDPRIRSELANWLLLPIILYGAAWYFVRPYERFPVLVSSWFSFVTDSLFATLWIYATGGFYSPYHILYYTSIIAVAYRYGIRTTMLSSAIYAMCYVALVAALGHWQHNQGKVLVNVGFIFIIGHMTWLITRETLLQTRQKLQLKSLMEKAELNEAKLTELNHTLSLQNEIFSHAEKNGHSGSYKWDLGTNQITYSDNLFRLLGYEPGAFEPSVEKYIEFVHPSEREQFRSYGQEALGNRKVREKVVHRIIRKDGSVRHFSVTASLTKGHGESEMVIGAIQDVTEDALLSQELRERNAELSRINHELSSFNYVASHDLQEPLRKILTFSQLIRDKESSLGEDTQNFLDRISGSARRMQSLIEAFLTYSHIGNGELPKESVNLNSVINDVENLLREQLEERRVNVKAGQLPVIQGVRIQLQQLFINLFTNAIKYSKPTEVPCITITASDVPGLEADRSGNSRARYWKISVADNGIGFEPEYCEKIFEVFHRLHSKDQYEGTGIGLAICRKVVSAHRGFIRAEGVPGQGATFHIYLPAER